MDKTERGLSQALKSSSLNRLDLTTSLCNIINNNRPVTELTGPGFVTHDDLVGILSTDAVTRDLMARQASISRRGLWRKDDGIPRVTRPIPETAQIVCQGFHTTATVTASLANTPPGLSHGGRSTQPLLGAACLRRIFATLLLIEWPEVVQCFIDDGLCDNDLPNNSL